MDYIEPLAAQYNGGAFSWSNGRSIINPYSMADRQPGFLNSDGNHGYTANLMAKQILGMLRARIDGAAAVYGSRSGKTYIVTCANGNVWAKLAKNNIGTLGSSTGSVFAKGLRATDGTWDPDVMVQRELLGVVTNSDISGATIADPDLNTADILTITMGNNTATDHVFRLYNQVPGDVVTITAFAYRVGAISMTQLSTSANGGPAKLLSAKTGDTNYVTLDPVTVPESGIIEVRGTPVGTGYHYMTGIKLVYS